MGMLPAKNLTQKPSPMSVKTHERKFFCKFIIDNQ